MDLARGAGIQSALVLAQVVSEDLTVGGVSSWHYWKDGLVAVDEGTRTFSTTKRLWALGHRSKFVRPGAQRLETFASQADSPLASACRNADGSLVVVLVNPADRERRGRFTRPALDGTLGDLLGI